jgi:hypothetical protein
MRHEAVFCYEDQNAAEADKVMQEKNLKHLPVVDRNMQIVGIISHDDVKGAAEASEQSQAVAPAEDWQPGKAQGADGGSSEAAEQTDREGASPESHAPGEEKDDVDHERFPFRTATESAEAR